MKIPFVDLYRQYTALQCEMDAAIASVIRESSFIRGPHVDAFEKNFSNLLGVPYTVACANGTDAIYIIMKMMGIGPGDEVITTAHTWISTSETITQTGAKVVFCDTDPETFCIDPNKIEALITPRTKAIIPVHLYGHPADMDPIMAIARQHGLKVIEDCAQAHLAMYHGRMIGTMGDAATFSFYPGKNLGAMGDAGCFVTADADLADRGATYARHGGKGEHIMEGINSRLDGLQAAILNVKIPHIKEWTAIRRGLANQYSAALSNIRGVTIPIERPNCEHVYHLYVIQHEQRDELKAHLQKCGVGTVLNYPKALPFYAAYDYLGHTPADFPTAYHHQSRILSLPIFPFMKDEELNYVVESIASFKG